MATLQFDDDSGDYVGPTLRIGELAFLDALQRCILAGEPPEQALARLQLEESWREPAVRSDEDEEPPKADVRRRSGWDSVCGRHRRRVARTQSRH